MTNIIDEKIERLRYRYKPDKVTILLVGESAPEAGTFFYTGDTLCKYTQNAFTRAYPEVNSQTKEEFLSFFQSKGFYLEDLCLIPVNGLDSKQRRQCIKNSVSSLAERIKTYSPIVVVAMLKRIEKDVLKSLQLSGINAQIYTVPFGGNGNQNNTWKSYLKL